LCPFVVVVVVLGLFLSFFFSISPFYFLLFILLFFLSVLTQNNFSALREEKKETRFFFLLFCFWTFGECFSFPRKKNSFVSSSSVNKDTHATHTDGRSKRREKSDRSRDRVGGGHVEISAFRGDDDDDERGVVYAMRDQHGHSVVVV